MKRLLIGFTVTFVAVVWMTGSWLFFNSIATGAQGLVTPAFAEKTGPKDGAAQEHYGEWKGHHRHFGRHGHFGLWKKLNLTDAQRNQIKTIVSEERPKMKPLFEQLKAGREQLNVLVKSGPFDEVKVGAIAKAQADTLADMIVEKQRMKSMMYAVLTPEQRAKAEKLHEAWKTLHGDGPGHND